MELIIGWYEQNHLRKAGPDHDPLRFRPNFFFVLYPSRNGPKPNIRPGKNLLAELQHIVVLFLPELLKLLRFCVFLITKPILVIFWCGWACSNLIRLRKSIQPENCQKFDVFPPKSWDFGHFYSKKPILWRNCRIFFFNFGKGHILCRNVQGIRKWPSQLCATNRSRVIAL